MTGMDVERMLAEHGARLKPKEGSRLMRVIGGFLRIFGNKRFNESYWTTLFRTIYYPTSVTDPYRHYAVIAHECVHVSQWRKWNVWFTLTYLFLPMPVLLAYGRWYWERQAYLVTLGFSANREQAIDQIVHNLWHEYLWTWPKRRMRKWFEANA